MPGKVFFMSMDYCNYCCEQHDTDFDMMDTVFDYMAGELIPGHKVDQIIINAINKAIQNDPKIKIDSLICKKQWLDILEAAEGES